MAVISLNNAPKLRSFRPLVVGRLYEEEYSDNTRPDLR